VSQISALVNDEKMYATKEMRARMSFLGTSKNDRVWTFLLLHVAANIILQFACAIDFVVILLCALHTHMLYLNLVHTS
jgi:hypothetical protein